MSDPVKDSVMFCCSTQNQTVNIIPALQLKVSKLVVFSTGIAEKRNWTKRLEEFCQNHQINWINVHIDNQTERHPEVLSELIQRHLHDHEGAQCYINIGGGQKPFTIAFYKVFSETQIDKVELVYTEGNKRQLLRFGKDMFLREEPVDVEIKLDSLMSLYGYKMKKCTTHQENDGSLKYAHNAANLLKNEAWFQRLFLRMCDNPKFDEVKVDRESIKSAIGAVAEKKWQDVIPTQEAYQHLENKLNDLLLSRDKADEVKWSSVEKIVNKPKLFKEYWNGVKNKMVESVIESINSKKDDDWEVYDCHKRTEERNRIYTAFESIGGTVSISEDGVIKKSAVKFPKANGPFFEEMVLSEVLLWMKQSHVAKSFVSQVYSNVYTAPENQTKGNLDAEYDIVLLTRFGTFIIIEIKSAKLEQETIKTREYGAYQKSGPYGKSISVGPLVSNLINSKGLVDSNIVPKNIAEQKKSANFLGSKYACFDQLTQQLEKMLKQE